MKEKHNCCQSHCCVYHGCKYGFDDCPVLLGTVKQDFLCYRCAEDGIESWDDLNAEIKIRTMSVSSKLYALELGVNGVKEMKSKIKDTNCLRFEQELDLMHIWLERQKQQICRW